MAQSERTLAEMFGTDAAVFLPEDGSLRPIVDHPHLFAADASEVAVAQWVFDRGRTAGRGTDTLPAAKALHIPLATPNGVVGVLAVRHDDPDRLLMPETRRLLETSAAQVALAFERDRLVEQAQAARVEAEAERLRGTLLAAVSHDCGLRSRRSPVPRRACWKEATASTKRPGGNSWRRSPTKRAG